MSAPINLKEVERIERMEAALATISIVGSGMMGLSCLKFTYDPLLKGPLIFQFGTAMAGGIGIAAKIHVGKKIALIAVALFAIISSVYEVKTKTKKIEAEWLMMGVMMSGYLLGVGAGLLFYRFTKRAP